MEEWLITLLGFLFTIIILTSVAYINWMIINKHPYRWIALSIYIVVMIAIEIILIRVGVRTGVI